MPADPEYETLKPWKTPSRASPTSGIGAVDVLFTRAPKPMIDHPQSISHSDSSDHPDGPPLGAFFCTTWERNEQRLVVLGCGSGGGGMRRDPVAMLFWALRWHEGRRGCLAG